MDKNQILLSKKFWIPGLILTFSGLVMVVIRFWLQQKPDFFELKTFAVYSIYLDTKYMKIISNNIIEEIGGVLLLAGLFFLCFAREKNESDKTKQLRAKAILITVYFEFVFLLFSFIFMYGFAFIYMLIINIFFPFIVYIIVFKSMVVINSGIES